MLASDPLSWAALDPRLDMTGWKTVTYLPRTLTGSADRGASAFSSRLSFVDRDGKRGRQGKENKYDQ
jgi:hypothetical protein